MERNKRIAIIGSKDNILPFRAVGVDIFPVNHYFEGVELFKKAAREYPLIFITEDIAKEMEDTINRYRNRPYPIVIPIPSASGSSGYGLDNISKDVEKAIGMDILNIK